MASICNQFKAHFPILDGGDGYQFSSRREEDFSLVRCWDAYRSDSNENFDALYEATLRPLQERITKPDPKMPNKFLIDGVVSLKLPTACLANRSIEFWEGRKNVATWSSAVVGVATLGLILALRPTTALIVTSMPILGVIFAVAAASLIVLGTIFAAFNFMYKLEAQGELDGWKQIQAHLPYLATFPEKIANIRDSIFKACLEGREVVAEQRSLLQNRFLDIAEDIILWQKGVKVAFPHLSEDDKRTKLIEKLRRRNSPGELDKRPLWNYRFPNFSFVPIT